MGVRLTAVKEVTLAQLLAISIQLLLTLLVIQRYQLENRTFLYVMALAAAGFVVNTQLPMKYRLPFFVALSLASILIALGPLGGASLVFLTVVPIGICHLPLSFRLRIVLLLAVAALFALWRAEVFHGPWPMGIWPILGSMLMFRLALYLYALKHDRMQPTVASTLAYFFMAPNVCFPLFPVVDYSTFRRTHYDAEPNAIYTTGMRWIARGLLQLVLYRVVYLHLVGNPVEVQTLGELVQFLLSTFLLYLRISGQFHLIVGFLHLFGFRLPETHHLYYLASSFSDFWRRINIYWKDFMMRLVYYPSFFELKRFSAKTALVGATIIVFIATWVLHSYQWFWLRGGFPLTIQDGLFWGLLGVLVIYGALREMKGGARTRKLGRAKQWSLSLGLKTTGTFAAICLLWSLWSAESVGTWVLMWGAAAKTSWPEILAISALVAGGIAIGGWEWPTGEVKAVEGQRPSLVYSLAPVATLVVLLALSWQGLYEKASPKLASLVASVSEGSLNARDVEQQHKGYYEKLDKQSRMSAQLWGISSERPAHWIPLSSTTAYERRSDFLGSALKPNMSITFLDKPFSTNSWGMRDRERSLEKRAGVYRIAVLGPSHVMGAGVGDAETFTRFLEEDLNQFSDGTGLTFEVLNFGISAIAVTQQVAMLQDRVIQFRPDAVFITDSEGIATVTVRHLLNAAEQRIPIPFKKIQEVADEIGITALASPGAPVPFEINRSLLASAGINTRMPWAEGERRARRARERIVQAAFEEIADISRKIDAVPVFVALNVVEPTPPGPFPALQDAAGAGLLVVDLSSLWEGQELNPLRVHPADAHANARGNRIIATRLRDAIFSNATRLRLPDRFAEYAKDVDNRTTTRASHTTAATGNQ